MTPDNIWIIKVILGCLSGLFGVLAAVLGFCETAQNEKYDDTRAWFGAKWQAINRSRWLTIPDDAVRWFIRVSRMNWAWLGVDLFRGRMLVAIAVLAPVFLIISCLFYWGLYVAIGVGLFSIILILASGATLKIERFLASFLYLLSLIAVFGGTVIVWTYMLLRLSVYYAAPIMLLLFPFYWLMAFLPILGLGRLGLARETQQKLVLFILGVTLGFTTTFMALLIGHVADPAAPVPQTLQMLASNVLFDGLTMVVTFAILSWAVERGWLLSIPLAVLLDLAAAGVLACCSLYFALVNTEYALAVREVLHVLVAHSTDGSRVELSPYFWTMHTTFLPTLAYLALILVTWFAKLILMPVKWFFGKGHEHKSPLKLTAALCTTIAVIFGLFTVGANSAYERAKEKAASAPAVAK